ncbi:MAG TPA: hypothetical protein PLG15_02370 [Candidatus Gastranaerophilaceae bacterium]|nr:hypothetical protein [Candidatus Gastranaerophilaceae bacterium]HPT41208.1 hypothetical protein [Candidatus Gastranaerophilaceae bacterium]
MTYPINTKLNQYPQGFSATPAIPVDAEKVKQSVNQNGLVKQAKEEENPVLLLGVMMPIWAAIGHLMAKFNYACSDANGKNILQKIADFGHNIGENKVFKSPGAKHAGNIFSNIKNFAKTKIIDKSSILSAMFKTPTAPEFQMAKVMSKGTISEVATDASQALDVFVAQHNSLDDALKALKIDKVLYENIKKDPYKHIDDIIDICKKQKGDAFVMLKKLGRMPLPKFLQRKVYFSELANKLTFLKGLKNPNPNLNVVGKVLPKMSIRTLEGFTNGTAGGKFAILMQAYIFASALIKAAKAPKGQKVKTFSENVFYDLGFYLTIPSSMALMHGAGGLKYIGMSEKQVDFYRKALEKLNASVDAGTISKVKYLKARKDLGILLKGNTKILKSDKFLVRSAKHLKNIVYNPLKWAGKMVSVGLERIKPYAGKDANAILKGFGKFKYKLKGAAGVPARFLLFSMVFAPFLAKYFAKASHLIFGRPTKSVLDDDKESKAPEQIKSQPTNQQGAVPTSLITPPAQSGNLVNMYNQQANKPVPQAVQPQQPASQQQIAPGQALQPVVQPAAVQPNTETSLVYPPKTANQTPPAPARTYVPSAEPIKQEKTQQMTEAEQKLALALQKADSAEQYAKKYAG